MDVYIKICGITNPTDAELAARLGADMIGLNFYAQSPRRITPATAQAIRAVTPRHVSRIGVFVNEALVDVQRISESLDLFAAQVHGELEEPLPRFQWIPAFSLSDATILAKINAFVDRQHRRGWEPSAILIDAHVPGMHGGTGQVAPWHLLADFKPGVPLILAGGLTPDNVGEAIRIVRPWAVDVASGVESTPGKKDADKMRRFIDAVRAAQ